MSSFVAVLDACVLIPASLRDTLLRAVEKDLYRMQWSNEILEEVRRNLVMQGMTSEEGAQSLVDEMKRYFPDASVDGYTSLTAAMTNDPKDRHVLAAAVTCGAQIIVTSNLRDFPKRALEPFHIEAQSPDEFLIHLFDLDPKNMERLLREQARDLRKRSKTVWELLDTLAQHTPRFAALMRDYLKT
ncbi:MAG TPA: PIN domain-containing protein [Ktedonobacterales bacterium]